MLAANLCIAPGAPIINTQVNHEKNFGFLEFRSSEECTHVRVV
jgi:hypothetical protein